ncbi:tRNA-splicing endonuclease subunit Sen34 [Chionoecetes opilio]|uniref:tRNA-intron lyase n=1 Tax=Chionoecetes opilio TaxID=41210 RepID=A0A8J4YP50_CHIOP|nr:tRNA-splicing endonuclease subunit Sen34 [Chionoecetes opilio]
MDTQTSPDVTRGAHTPMEPHPHKVQVTVTHGLGYIWDLRDVWHLWKECRVVGSLTGTLPRHPHQTTTQGLPLSLLPEEVTLLLEEGLGETIGYKEMDERPCEGVKDVFRECRVRCYEEQVNEAASQRRVEIRRMADKILEGKRRKFLMRRKKEREVVFSLTREEGKKEKEKGEKEFSLSKEEGKEEKEKEEEVFSLTREEKGKKEENKEGKERGEEEFSLTKEKGELFTLTREEKGKEVFSLTREEGNKEEKEDKEFTLTREDVIREEEQKLQPLPQHLQVVEVFTQHPLLHHLTKQPYHWTYPTTNQEKLRSKVFIDLWRQNYYLTSGLKFGGDFLVYAGDPHICHAHAIVRCVGGKKGQEGSLTSRRHVGSRRLRRKCLWWRV